jgi:deoxyribodipyrimidine photo-lyase
MRPRIRPPTLVWFRQDLRLRDHRALTAAITAGAPVIPVYIWAPDEEAPWAPGAASRWWLHHSLQRLDAELRERGSRLILRQGSSSADCLQRLAAETGAGAAYWHRQHEPDAAQRDARLLQLLCAAGVEARDYGGALLQDPARLRNKTGRPYLVFTPFYRHLLSQPPPGRPLRAPTRIPAPTRWPASLALGELGLLPAVDWAGGIRDAWTPGETGATRALQRFLRGPVTRYPTGRDRPDHAGTAAISPHLHFGELSAAQAWHAATAAAANTPDAAPGVDAWLRQLAWREFAAHLLYHFPSTATKPLREPYRAFPWRHDPRRLRAWQQGRTGYPIVDAGMRELWTTGWMHNRVRMIAASFLVKDLLIPWQDGARWFWDTLVDADLANNTMGWQWIAGCGADAAPFFRIFNPVSQGRKFDPDGAYIRRWVPALRNVPDAYVHEPWKAPGNTYPERIVQHHVARMRALAALQTIRNT